MSAPSTVSADPSLDALRREIDAVDGEMHALLMRRAEIVERIRAAKAPGTAVLRPGREARILRALVARHRGTFPARALVRVWRDILGGFVLAQAPFSVAIADPDPTGGLGDLARDHFGAAVPIGAQASARRVIDAVTAGRASIGVLPAFRADDRDPWWPLLIGGGRPSVIVRLPVAPGGNARGEGLEAYVVARARPEDSGDDRTLLAIETTQPLVLSGLVPALARAGLAARLLGDWADPAAPLDRFYLVEVEGFVEAADQRLLRVPAALERETRRVAVLGAYPAGFSAADLARAG